MHTSLKLVLNIICFVQALGHDAFLFIVLPITFLRNFFILLLFFIVIFMTSTADFVFKIPIEIV